MKKLLLLLLFITGLVNAQIVNIPDANFKAKLLEADTNNQIARNNGVNIKIDTNNDGEIQESEVLNVTELIVNNSNISDLTGIEAFLNLFFLSCDENQLTALNFSSLLDLEQLSCAYNPITTLDVSDLQKLKVLYSFNTSITSLNASGCSSLWGLVAYECQLSTLNISGCSALTTLQINNNKLSVLDVSNFVNLTELNASSNLLSEVNVANCTALTSLDLSYNQLQSIDLSKCPALTTLFLYQNQLELLEVPNSTSLNSIDVTENQLTNLNALGCKSLEVIYANSNMLTDLNVSECTSLNRLWVAGNQLTTLDVSTCFALNDLAIDVNPIITLFIKNNSNEILTSLMDVPLLEYICADEFQIDSIKNLLNQAGMTNTVVNSYCSFIPAGDYNSIKGNVRFDSDANGCDPNDIPVNNNKIIINDGIKSRTIFVNQLGEYVFYAQETNITLTPIIENPDYYSVSPTSVALNALEVNGITQTQDFCVTANGIQNDLEVVIVPIGIARPGFDAKYKIVYKNKGNQTLSGDIVFDYKDSYSDFVSASIIPNNQTEDQLTWTYLDLKPFESRTIDVVFNVNSPMETPAVNDGDILSYIATITPIESDSYDIDNSFPLRQIVVNSLDPNDITCLEGNKVSPNKIGEYLHYNINFENIGTASAVNIVVKDIIDATKFDISSLEVLYSSHTMNTKITDNKAEFIFENINLEAKQHGNVTFKIKTKNTLQTGDSVLNNADIFFDYNFPIATNDEVTVFQTLSKTEFTIDKSIKMYPNPVNDFVVISANDLIKSIQMYDFQGRIIKISSINETQTKFDISNYANGVYFLKVQTEKGSKIEKVIKK